MIIIPEKADEVKRDYIKHVVESLDQLRIYQMQFLLTVSIGVLALVATLSFSGNSIEGNTFLQISLISAMLLFFCSYAT